MTELQAALYRYARESRVEGFLRPERRELEANRRMVGEAMASLSAMGEAPCRPGPAGGAGPAAVRRPGAGGQFSDRPGRGPGAGADVTALKPAPRTGTTCWRR